MSYIRAYFQEDPRWIFAKYKCKCRKCGATIDKGNRAFYYPKGKEVYCEDPCGYDAYNDLRTCNGEAF